MSAILDAQGNPIRMVRTMRAQYAGARWTIANTSIPNSYIDYDKDLPYSDRATLASKSRWFYQNFSLYQTIIDRLTVLTVGSGVQFNPATGNELFNEVAKMEFDSWKSFADVTEMEDWDALQATAVRNAFIDGFCLIVLSYVVDSKGTRWPRVQLVPSHQLDKDGVVKNKRGVVTKYIISGNPIPAKNVIVINFPKFIGEIESPPLLSSVINTCQDLCDILQAERNVVKNQSNVDRVITTKSGEIQREDFTPADAVASAMLTGHDTEVETDDTWSFEQRKNYYENVIGPKSIVLANGDSYKPFESNRPSSAFMGLVEALEDQIIAASALPQSILNSRKMGGVDSRKDMAMCARVISQYQQKLSKAFQRIYRFVMGTLISSERVPMQDDWYSVSYGWPAEVTADLGRATQADLALLNAGVNNLKDMCEPYGLSWRDAVKERAEQIEYIRKYAEAKNIDPAALMPSLFPSTKTQQ